MNDATLALHGLAIKKHGGPAEVAAITGLAEDAARRHLEDAEARGRVSRAGEAFVLTPAAGMALRSGYSRDFAAQRDDPDMTRAYEAFEVVNNELKRLITEWQTIEVGGERVPNDHSDAEHDARVVDRLGDLHDRAEPVLDRLAAGLPRLAAYKDLLLAALERAEDGAREWVSDAKIPSYHTVWFELHEDLLRVLGREREE